MIDDPSFFPEAVVRSMFKEFIPKKDILLKVLLLNFVERSEIEVELVSVRSFIVERNRLLPGWLAKLLAKV